ncbi:AAA family ATPase [Immersiella caudata]|uniref:AAA family ATPase n=1 Tax=Immersiella caudata TaxID=314043 RepID=A0AA39WFQ0_9PEZI|nr:AAA family ATPase [Immersiella caudata]
MATARFRQRNIQRERELAMASSGPSGAPDEAELQEMVGHLTEEDKARRAELEKASMQAELKHLEKRWTKKGRPYVTEPKEEEAEIGSQTNWHEKFALCVTRQYDLENKKIQRTSLQVNSKALRDILNKVITSYPGQIFSTADVAIDFPAPCLYHYRHELAAALDDQEPGSDGHKHLPILLGFIEEQFTEEIRDEINLLSQGVVTYINLWTIFRPGCLIFSYRKGQPCVCKLISYQYIEGGQNPGLQLALEYVDYDGDLFGTRIDSFKLQPYSGTAFIAQLEAYPLSYHPNSEAITATLTARGRRWEAFAGQKHMSYSGVATDTFGFRYNINSRVMVDTFTFHRMEANHAYSVTPFPSAPGVSSPNIIKRRQPWHTGNWDIDYPSAPIAPLTDTQALLSSPTVRGFSFNEKKFLNFFVDKLSPIVWNPSCFDQLVLPQSQKELVQALVAEHTSSSSSSSSPSLSPPSSPPAITNDGSTPDSDTSSPLPFAPPPSSKPQRFDDIIKSKGLGLILVLHGPPGVGKTLTAECVSEFSHLPLYPISSGDLGTTSTLLETRLTRTLDLASTWNAILLIDEADIFLERRSLHDLERNSLVSIFLRVLEYYPGILFLTTNRIKTFDDAFKSRIHVPLKYTNLSKESRLTVWRNFLAKVDEKEVSEEEMRVLSEEGRLNGRQIKNVVRTAKSLAGYKRRRLDYGQLREVMEIQMAFERDLEDVEGEE